MNGSPGRIIQSRITCGATGGLGEAALDANGNAWARYCDETWKPWVQVAAGAIDVDIAAAPPDGDVFALVIATPATPGGGRQIHTLNSDGTVTATPH